MVDGRARPARRFTRWLAADTAPGLLLVAATVVALVWANRPFAHVYHTVWEFGVGPAGIGLHMDLRHWVNDGLMVLFFFVIGLELKQELTTGDLAHPRVAALPALAAVGGAVVPAAVFLAVTWGGPAVAGWGVPMATDPAFAVGVLALVARGAPPGVRALLLAIATVDDALAVAVIAIGYSAGIHAWWLLAAVAGFVGVVALRALGVTEVWPYAVVGLLVWYATLQSGVHATIAGVGLALLTPAGVVGGRDVIARLLTRLGPVSSYLVVPIFAVANIGIELSGDAALAAFGSEVTWGVLAGLLLGKMLGIVGTLTLASRIGLGRLPDGVSTRHLFGLGLLGALGFTVALFITELAYTDPVFIQDAKIGILVASTIGAALAAWVLAARHGVDK
jgi:NhaA family Na+:H+ antiporter